MKCSQCHKKVPEGVYCNLCGWDQRVPPEKFKLETLFERLEQRHFRRIGESTKVNYRRAWQQLKPLHHRLITEITLDEWQLAVDEALPCSFSTVHKMKTVISLLYKQAQISGCTINNLAPHLILDAEQQKTTMLFTDKQLATLLKACETEGEYQKTCQIAAVMVFTGFRPNELFKLKKKDVNLDAGFFVGGSKTAAGKNRIVPILSFIKPFVEEWTKKAPTNESFLLVDSIGGCLNLRNWRERHFYPMTQEIGLNTAQQIAAHSNLQRITPYSCRHTFATLAYRAGVRPEMLTKMIGHTKFVLTAEIYIHSEVEILREEAAKITQFIRGIA